VSAFTLPLYHPPDFTTEPFLSSPNVTFQNVLVRGVAPEPFHATSIFPEYFQIRRGEWTLLRESRMDCVVALEDTGTLTVKELRHLKPGERIACGRGENGEDGIYVHTHAFRGSEALSDKFQFRSRPTRETSFSTDYDELYNLLKYERTHGFILWVLGPAVVFDRDARESFVSFVERGYVHALFAGNALATHDIEGALYGTALGQDIYSKRSMQLGHYNHLDALNRVRAWGGIEKGIEEGMIKDGIMRALVMKNIPFVLAGSIRDDGPLPEVISDACRAQDGMRAIARKTTTVIALATQLHSIATGNMVPSYTITAEGQIRPVYFYIVDMSEFAVSKLANRGSLTVRSILTNVQDFIVTVSRGLK